MGRDREQRLTWRLLSRSHRRRVEATRRMRESALLLLSETAVEAPAAAAVACPGSPLQNPRQWLSSHVTIMMARPKLTTL
mmetsp:Transcript_7440/g.30246  ORF Transcript_7440/g.30246 Transcript_7440/m.30246 type:complete len:80 (+) Transcript_7440:938-1177(+)